MKHTDTKTGADRAQFATRLGVIAATVGSAVGLGNIWRFPYEAGTHGGAAFMAIYIAFVFLLGVPVLCAEFALGRTTHKGIFGALKALRPGSRWPWLGVLTIIATMMILSFYSVVAGWTFEYFADSVSGRLAGMGDDELHHEFTDFISGWRPIMWTVLFLAANYFVTVRGVQKGVEKASNIMTPLLFVLLIVFCVNSLLLPGARAGLEFLFKPDFSQITGQTVISAMGQAFFSLSLGMGVMLTYASYFKDDTNILRSATLTAGLDTAIAILAGVLIFPAVFTYGLSPAEGPTLVFEVLPSFFNRLPAGMIWATLFFLMLALAALTSTISLMEGVVTYLTEETRMNRRTATLVTVVTAMTFGVLCALSFSYLSHWPVNFFDLFDYASSNIVLPLGGVLLSIFAGWVADRAVMRRALARPGGDGRIGALAKCIIFIIRWVAPALIAVIFVMNL